MKHESKVGAGIDNMRLIAGIPTTLWQGLKRGIGSEAHRKLRRLYELVNTDGRAAYGVIDWRATDDVIFRDCCRHHHLAWPGSHAGRPVRHGTIERMTFGVPNLGYNRLRTPDASNVLTACDDRFYRHNVW